MPDAKRRAPRTSTAGSKLRRIPEGKRGQGKQTAPRSAPPRVPTRPDLPVLMDSIAGAVEACARLHGWDVLEAAVKSYATALRVDPTLLLNAALLWANVRHAMRYPDDDAFKNIGPPLAEAIETMRAVSERGGTMAVFYSTKSAGGTEGVH